ncbi:MAG: LLM class flavin-dependent oxidoreductase [Candidatus Rokubacteria bacterium]|nr:LLM class flavin-dependent oxidoreductase [Candidatus Rokubacteria bacterium]
MAEPVRVHLRVPGTAPLPELMTLIRSIEAAGFDGVGILDSQMLCRDTFVTLGQAATHTSRLTLFPAVTNPFTRHASVLAGAIQTVEELAPGRVKFVIGTGYTSASTIGLKPATLAQMRACLTTVKALLAGQTIDFSGTRGRLGYAAGRPLPVLMAASGPKAIELAGEIADGALLLVGFNRGIVETALAHLERGARRSGRRLEDLEIIWAVRTGTAATTEEARRLARPIAVHWGILRWGGDWLGPAGIRIPKLEIPDAVGKIYPDLSHAHDWEAAIAATSFVPDEIVAQLCDALGLIGTPADCAARIGEMTKLGPRNLYLMPFQTFAAPEPEIRAFRDVVFPRLRAAGLR